MEVIYVIGTHLGSQYNGIYINGELFAQGVLIDSSKWYKLGQLFPDISFEELPRVFVKSSWLEIKNELPKEFSNIPPLAFER